MTTEVTANPAENGTAPGMSGAGYGTSSFTGTPTGAGFATTVDTTDRAARFEVVAPQAGATLVGWGIDTTDLEDVAVGASSADFVAVLVDDGDTFVGNASWTTAGDTFDYNGTDASFPTRTPGLEIRTDGNDDASGSAVITLTTGIPTAADYWIEILGFALAFAGDADLTMGRVYTVWELPTGWLVGSIALPG